MNTHSADRPNLGRTLRVAMLCAGVLIFGACSTTFLIDEYGLVTVTDPVCSRN